MESKIMSNARRPSLYAPPHGGSAGGNKVVGLGDLMRIRSWIRSQSATIALTNGCYDLFHLGHLRSLQGAAAEADYLVVAVAADQVVRELKGPTRPVQCLEDRVAMVAALTCVDYVWIQAELTPIALLRHLRPEVLVKGGDYALSDVIGAGHVHSYGGRVVVTEHVVGWSTSAQIERLLHETPQDDRLAAGPERPAPQQDLKQE